MGLLDFFRKKKISLADSGILKGMSDCHSHILPGVDDGVSDIQKSIEILAYMESVGISQVWCTPHIMDDFPNSPVRFCSRRTAICFKAIRNSRMPMMEPWS